MMVKSRRIGWDGHVGCMGELINSYKIYIGKPG
jgi:hypothetical protein